MSRIKVNITPRERLGRIVVGALAVVAGLILLAVSGGILALILELLLIIAGLDLVVTGALGHCPLYSWLGYTPKSLRSQS